MNLESKIQEFDQILKVITAHRDLPSEPLVEAGAVILQEIGKDRRAEILRDLRFNSRMVNSDSATEKQKAALRTFGIEISSGITKQEASALLSELFGELRAVLWGGLFLSKYIQFSTVF